MSDILFQQTELVPTLTLKPYGNNPRKGNVRAIAESLATNKQYRPIVVQKSTNQILAGNHTWQAAKLLKWASIAVVYVDVDEEQAKRIVLADNRTNDLAEYDNQILAELLRDLQTPEGTGYTESDMEALLQVATEVAAEVDEVFGNDTTIEDVMTATDKVVTGGLATEDDLQAEEDWKTDIENDEKSDGTGVGVFNVKADMQFPGATFWEIPRLHQDMMIEELPQPLHTWAGSATRDLGWEGYWLYNWGIDSTSGMTDLSKIFLSFYAFDEYFDCWWEDPSRYLAKVINSKIKYAITPNYTQGGMPRAESLYQMYRSRWVGRYLQEVGCRVMPDMECRTDSEFIDIFCKSLPDRVPWAAVQVQNFFMQTRGGDKATDEDRKQWAKDESELVKRAKVENLLVYVNPNQNDLISSLLQPLIPDVHLEFMPTRLHYLSAHRKAKAKANLK